MAENKKGFLMYADQRDIFKSLTDEEAGKLVKHLFAYVNDENPKSERLIELIFEPIKSQLKRDLKKWEGEKIDKSNSGRLGNLKRWNTDLYKQVIDNQITLEQAEKVAHDRKVSHTDKKVSHHIANIAVNVNDNVTVNVNDNVKKENKTEKATPLKPQLKLPFDSDDFKKVWFVLIAEKKWRKKSDKALAMALKILSEFAEQDAIKMMEAAIAGEWQGIHVIKSVNTAQKKESSTNAIDNLK